ncbi:hypothetical protein ABZ297_00665 [Nonomuraea sp. NPDC005983]|uniref:hypothetical protein n=1 Tax=Nonomuraea sp. NPDC005983 TaxID=3155595 RepID=UPI0033BBFF28
MTSPVQAEVAIVRRSSRRRGAPDVVSQLGVVWRSGELELPGWTRGAVPGRVGGCGDLG